MKRRGVTILELEVAILLAAFAAVTLASLLAQQVRVVERLTGVFGSEQVIYLAVTADELQRQLRLPPTMSHDLVSPWSVLPAIPPGDITVITVSASDDSISLIADVFPTSGEPE